MTLKIAQSIARANGMSIRKTQYNEYRVAVIGDKDEKAVYENTIGDALDTAQVMHANLHKGLKHYWVV